MHFFLSLFFAALQVQRCANESSFSNTRLCKPQQSDQAAAAAEGSSRRHVRTRKGHKRNASEGSASLLLLHAGAIAVRDEEDASKDNTWRKMCREFVLPGRNGKPVDQPADRHAFSPSAQGSAFRNWSEAKKRIEQLVPAQALESVGSDVTLQSTSSQSSAALSTSTTCSSPQTDIDSVAEIFPNFPAASFRPFANGARSASPATSSISRSTNLSPGHSPPIKDTDDMDSAAFHLPALMSAPRIVPVQLLDITGSGSVPNRDSEHVFRPVMSGDTTDTESITSCDTVIGPIPRQRTEKPEPPPLPRQRSASDASYIQLRTEAEPVTVTRLSKTPPTSIHHSVQSSTEHLPLSPQTKEESASGATDRADTSKGESSKGESSKSESSTPGSSTLDVSVGKPKSRWDFIFRRATSSTSSETGSVRSNRREQPTQEQDTGSRANWRGSIAHDPRQQDLLTHELRTRTLPLASRHGDMASVQELRSRSQQGKSQSSPSPPASTGGMSKGSSIKSLKITSSKPSSKAESVVPSRAAHSPVEDGQALPPPSPGSSTVDVNVPVSSPTSRTNTVSKKRGNVHRNSVSEMEHRRLPGTKKKREETNKGTR